MTIIAVAFGIILAFVIFIAVFLVVPWIIVPLERLLRKPAELYERYLNWVDHET